MVYTVVNALHQYVKYDCELDSLPDPKHYAAFFTKFHAIGKANKEAPLHVGFAADVGCGDAIEEIKVLRVSVVPASLKIIRLISRCRARCKSLKRG